MELYLLRHAKAVERGTPGYLEENRPLTEDGISTMREAARGIVKIVPKFDVIASSPLERAVHTANIVADTFQDNTRMQICNQLSPDTQIKGLLSYLSKYKNKQRLLLVGHEPDLGRIASALLGTEDVILQFKKGGMCRIDVSEMPPEKPGILVWVLPPKFLRRLGKKGNRS